MRSILTLGAILCGVATSEVSANPLVMSHPVYISSERMTVTVDRLAARFEGRFTFRSALGQNAREEIRKEPMLLQVPIWFPANAVDGDETTRAFWMTFKRDRLNWVNAENRLILDRAIGLRVLVGAEEIPYRTFAVFETSPEQDRIPREWQQPGLSCVLFSLDIPSNRLQSDPKVTITYRQPLLAKGDVAEFFYLPLFWHLPQGTGTDDQERYSFCLQARPKCLIRIQTSDGQVRPTRSVALPLSHNVPIRATVESSPN